MFVDNLISDVRHKFREQTSVNGVLTSLHMRRRRQTAILDKLQQVRVLHLQSKLLFYSIYINLSDIRMLHIYYEISPILDLLSLGPVTIVKVYYSEFKCHV